MPSLHEVSAVPGASRRCTSGAPSGPVQRGRDMTESVVSGWRFKSASGISNSTSAPVVNDRRKRMVTRTGFVTQQYGDP